MSLIGNNNEEKIWNYLKIKIGNEYGVAGLMGNLRAESGLSPINLQNSYEKKLGLNDTTYTTAVDNGSYTNFIKDAAGYGLAQWTYWSRKQNLLNFAKGQKKSIGDLEMQLDFLMQELSTGYKTVYNGLKSAKSVKEASNYVLLQFERPADQSVTVQNKRASYGEEYYKKYAGTSVAQNNVSAPVQPSIPSVTKTGYTNSSLISYTKISPNRTSPRNHVIDTITIHCFVGQVTAQQGANAKHFTNYDPKNGASCNYVVGKDGKISLVCPESDRSWCSSNKDNDMRAVTIEVACDSTAPYTVNSTAMNALIQLCVDICKRNNISKLVWSTNKNDRVNHKNGCNMTVHRDYANKSCPGDYLYGKHQYIANEVNKILGGGSAVAPAPSAPVQPSAPSADTTSFKIKILVDELNIRSGAGLNYPVVGSIKDKGIYTIVEAKNGWGLLKSYKEKRNGWVSLNSKYSKRV